MWFSRNGGNDESVPSVTEYEIVGPHGGGEVAEDEFVVTLGELRQSQGKERDGKTDHYPIVVKYEVKGAVK